jgi:hypothetical protein
MESSTPTGQIDPGMVDGASEPVWVDDVSARSRPTMTVSTREQCSACGAGMASDQRYCVECGQRRGPARVPLLDGTAHRAGERPTTGRAARRPSMSVNSTLIAIIGTLLLAMGVGVLIGRSSNNNVKSLPAQVVTVPGGGGTASTTTPTTGPQSSSAGAAQTTKPGGASAASRATSATKKPAAAPLKTVTVGSAGKGPGYQHGHFTGNFFGPESE